MKVPVVDTVKKRWHAVKNIKANLVLVLAGCLLLLMAPAWRFIVAPALRVVATDIEQVLQYEGSITYFLEPPGGQQAEGAQPTSVPIRIAKTVRSEPLVSTPETAVFYVETSFYDSSGRLLSEAKREYSVDRKSGELVKSSGSGPDRSGYYIVFPFDTPRGQVPLWSELVGKTFPSEYDKDTRTAGLATYRFAMSNTNQPTADIPGGYPETLTGAELKQWVKMPELPLKDASEIKPTYKCNQKLVLSVEPRMGTIVETPKGSDEVLLTVNSGSGDELVSTTLYALDYKQIESSVKAIASFAKEEVSKLRLQFAYIPLGFLLLGLALLLIGSFAGVRPVEET